MFNAPQPALENCTHERRPGTAVCLHCRHAARLSAAARRKRLMLRGTAVGIATLTVGGIAIVGASALHARMTSKQSAMPVQVVASSAASAAPSAASVDAEPVSPPVTQQGEIAAPTAGATPATPARVPVSPAIAIGETSLPDGVIAQRVADTVTVSFDNSTTRTRMPDKFEHFLRTTLARVYGAPVEQALAHVGDGMLVPSQQALLYDLPTRGIHIPLGESWQIAVYPQIRPGQDGPLVVRYRTSVVPSQN